jgi:hypothetical protein
MPFYQPAKLLPQRFRLVLASFMQHAGLPFQEVLSEEKIAQVFAEEKCAFAPGDDAVYTPAVTLWAFLSQTLFKAEHRSCAAAVARVVVLYAVLGKKPCSGNTGAYCRARAKLAVSVIQRLTVTVADGCEQKVPTTWLWKGRHVCLVDGATASMPDTPENQEAYPQPTTQAKGIGFPLLRMVVMISLATAMVRDMAMGPYAGKETGEPALLRELLASFQPGDIFLADRYFCSYFTIALLLELKIDLVVRLHQCRTADLRRSRRLGAGDSLVTWTKPQRPSWMDQETYERMPATIRVRQVHVSVHEKGSRVEELVVVTTLTDAALYCRDDIAELYHQRWLVELDIRALKCTMGMDVLRCQSPAMVAREMWSCLLAYNLIRQTLLESALAAKRSPRQLSFTAALQKIVVTWQILATAAMANVVDVQLNHLATHIVGDRPGRVEPRKVKRRPKPHKLLTQPRAEARAQLMAGVKE